MGNYGNRRIGGHSCQSKLIFLRIYITKLLYHKILYFFSLFNRKRPAKRKARNVCLKVSYRYRFLPNFTGNSNFQRTVELWRRANFNIARLKKILKTVWPIYKKRSKPGALWQKRGILCNVSLIFCSVLLHSHIKTKKKKRKSVYSVISLSFP